jgi:hypothetical protein
MEKKKTDRKALEVEIRELESKVRRLQRRIRLLKSLDDSKYGPDGRLRPHSDAEFPGGI